MKLRIMLIVRISVIAILAVAFASVALGKRGSSSVTRITFARGQTTKVERGELQRGMSQDYLVKVSAGQSMAVHLAASASGYCDFDLLSPAGDALARSSKDWIGKLHESGDYRIHVFRRQQDTTTERSVQYAMDATLQ